LVSWVVGELRVTLPRSCKKSIPTKGRRRTSLPTSIKRKMRRAETIDNSDYLR
jgi:hypothetical protein